MSAMLEAYDMPMLEYQADLDIQMQPSSSDQWVPEESHMEEDIPGVHMKTENYSSPKQDDHLNMKADSYAQEKSEVTIEIDMEPFPEHQNNEYEMQEDEPVLLESVTEAQDVEVYDVPLTQSPFIIPSLSVSQSIPSTFSGHFDHAESSHHTIGTPPVEPHSSRSPAAETYDLDIAPLDHTSTSVDVQPEVHDVSLEIHDEVYNISTEVHEVHDVHPEIHEVHPEVHEAHDVQVDGHEVQDVLPENPENYHVLPQTEPQEHTQSEPPGPLNATEDEETLQETLLEVHTHNLEGTPGDQNTLPESSELLKTPLEPDLDVHEKEIADKGIQPESDDHPSVNDPHEISEGVYIDPPPPVLLSVTSEDNYNFSFFNESPEWADSHSSGVVFLAHLPTLYYEPLSAVFEALHEEEYLQSLFHLPERELVLDAVDLQLAISEDNVYAREVTLHDLNVLHDISGTNGLLRMRLYAPTHRFIIRYQYLQEQVSRLNIEQSTVQPPSTHGQHEVRTNEISQEQTDEHVKSVNQNAENAENSQSVDHLSNSEVQDGQGGETPTNTSHPPPGQGSELSSSEGLTGNKDTDHRIGNHNDEFEATVDIHDPDSYPPLPADYEEEGEEGEADETAEDIPLAQQDSFQPHLVTEFHDTSQSSEPELANAESDENVGHEEISRDLMKRSEHVLPLEDQGQGTSEKHHEEEAGEAELPVVVVEDEEEEEAEEAEAEEAEEEEEEYDYADENHALGQEDTHPERSFAQSSYTDGEDGESGHTESLNEEEEYVEDAVESGDPDAISHSTNDDVEYAHEEADHALGEESFETSGEDFEYNHADGGVHSADLESLEGQTSAHEDPGVDPVSGPDINEDHNEPEVSGESGNYANLEANAEFESENVWELSIDHTGQETYDWEENVDDDTQWDKENEKSATNSNHSSVTLSSKTSKRSFDEFEIADEFGDEGGRWSPPSSPGTIRSVLVSISGKGLKFLVNQDGLVLEAVFEPSGSRIPPIIKFVSQRESSGQVIKVK